MGRSNRIRMRRLSLGQGPGRRFSISLGTDSSPGMWSVDGQEVVDPTADPTTMLAKKQHSDVCDKDPWSSCGSYRSLLNWGVKRWMSR
ncbi:hypothetical protein AVEN_257746-1 [Araneus ventricosus]|uniref:Uncharacterized protein n=1 Tax=Araneus ventricosus TaxID=182803 RepID=A0A4Y2TFC9_ARAVE|nr:hypothetical protein AVEN_12861-1 [Araneus ventricosus]GBN99354.1 hypothetical protein AVEN_177205-1 [Araneus ventricosus]GBO00278.1 hypothetical protein AVEN_5629-1 [Araneus ventricosus]GBO00282.1 hypothetical protein AVEN_257746-1 [Araneus ventricosus]